MDKIINKFLKSFKKHKYGCWLWIGSIDKDGYGRLNISHEKTIGAHRFSYELFWRKIPMGYMVCHSCDVPGCVNPLHLWLGTALDNNRDAIKKGRAIKVTGERHGMSKLTSTQVREIRKAFKTGYYTHQHLAFLYNISRKTVGNIVNNKNWI